MLLGAMPVMYFLSQIYVKIAKYTLIGVGDVNHCKLITGLTQNEGGLGIISSRHVNEAAALLLLFNYILP
jgi:hypothetical protein